MKVTLKKAQALALQAKTLANKIQVNYRTTASSSNVLSVIEAEIKAVTDEQESQINSKIELTKVTFALRALVAKANTKKDIGSLLTRIAEADELKRTYESYTSEAYTCPEDLASRIVAANSKEGYTSQTQSIQAFSKGFSDNIKQELINIRRVINTLNDELTVLNNTLKVELDAETVQVLEKYGLA